MKRVIDWAALGLGGIGLAGCLAGLMALWVVRPAVLRSSANLLDAADGGLTLVEGKAKQAEAIVGAIRGAVEPATSKILKLADKADRTPEDEKELKRIDEVVAQRLGQVDTLAELGETAIAFLNKASRVTRSFRFGATPGVADPSPAETSKAVSEALARLAKELKSLREDLARLRADKQVQKELASTVVRLARDVDNELNLVESTLERVRQKAAEFGTEIAELRTAVPAWTNWAAILGSVVLVWIGLGQFALSRWGWTTIRGPGRE